MKEEYEKIIYIPGLGENTISELCFGIENCQYKYKILEKHKSKTIKYTFEFFKNDKDEKIIKKIELIPIDWADLLKREEVEELNFLEKTMTILYWIDINFLIKVWDSKNRRAGLLLIFSSAILIIWYIFYINLFLNYLITTPGLIGNSDISAAISSFISLIQKNLKWLFFGISLIFITGRKVFQSYLNMIYSIEKYLINDKIRFSIRKRIINTILSEKKIKKIVTHSFGSTLALDLLANFEEYGDEKLELITMGSSINILSFRSMEILKILNEIKHKLEKENSKLYWTYYFSSQDYLSPDNLSFVIKDDNFTEIELMSYGGLVENIRGNSHLKYFYISEVIEKILESE